MNIKVNENLNNLDDKFDNSARSSEYISTISAYVVNSRDLFKVPIEILNNLFQFQSSRIVVHILEDLLWNCYLVPIISDSMGDMMLTLLRVLIST
jgi:hypothetical protein